VQGKYFCLPTLSCFIQVRLSGEISSVIYDITRLEMWNKNFLIGV